MYIIPKLLKINKEHHLIYLHYFIFIFIFIGKFNLIKLPIVIQIQAINTYFKIC